MALTSGPQDDQSKALNVGVAAHISAASEGGARYNPAITSEERRHPNNGIWLCQTCAKLIDNDASQFPEGLVRAWKIMAEHRALTSIGKTATPIAESEPQRKLRAILPWKGKPIRLTQMNPEKTALMLGHIGSTGLVQLINCTEFHVQVGKPGNEGWSRSIPLDDIKICFDEHDCLELQVPRF
jgi:hypothetical protein